MPTIMCSVSVVTVVLRCMEDEQTVHEGDAFRFSIARSLKILQHSEDSLAIYSHRGAVRHAHRPYINLCETYDAKTACAGSSAICTGTL